MADIITNETLKKYAEIATDAFMEDPVYQKVAKDEKKEDRLFITAYLSDSMTPETTATCFTLMKKTEVCWC